MRRAPKIAPGEGERRALVGYGGQYRVQACLLIRALRDGHLEWIKIADPEAGKLDDFQIGSPGRVDAYQVKWSSHPGSVTFQKLSGGNPGLFKQLAEGRQRIQREHVSARVVAHLVTNDHPSTSTGSAPINEEAKPTPPHFAAFLTQVWQPVKRESLPVTAIPADWKTAWEKLTESSGLIAGEFAGFVRDCELEFDFRAEPPAYASQHERVKLEEQIVTISAFFAQLVASPERVIRLTRAELLSRLNWSSRYEFRNLHEFPVDYSTYQPIEETVNALDHAVGTHSKGYVCVLGSPGSGKSTLLTETLLARRERVIRYYAFVRDDFGPVNARGESENFLHDMTSFLSQAGFRPDCDIAHANRQELSGAFRQQLQLLEDDFGATGRKTFILVDGLDHVRREQASHIDRDFFGDLPLPNQMPNGVLFVLGTQTLAPLPPQIQHHIESDATRKIETKPLSRIATAEILKQVGLGALTSPQQQRIFDVSAGHPLALHYVIELVREHPADVDRVLEATPDFTGDIEDTYRSYWDEISTGDYALSELMGLIARLRPAVDLRWIQTWANPEALNRLQMEFSHYFTRESERWFFFHNSFRRFLIAITARSTPGEFSEIANQRFHRNLAESCGNAPREHSSWRWEQIYHSSEANDHTRVLSVATQHFFREQFFSSRPASAILADIRLARRSLAFERDPVAAVRLSLAWTEIWRRNDDLSLSVPVRGERNVLIETGHVEEAIARVRQGMRLVAGQRGAIEWCNDFLEAGHVTEAKRIFALIDPLAAAHEFHGFHPQRNEQTYLISWASAALHPNENFASIEKVIRVIQRFEFTTEDQRQLALASAATQRNNIFTRIGECMIQRERADAVAALEAVLDNRETNYHACIHRLEKAKAVAHRKKGDELQARAILDREIGRIRSNHITLRQNALFDAAELCLTLGQSDNARDLIADIARPKIARSTDDLGGAFKLRFRHDRLRYALGATETSAQLVPDAAEWGQRGVVQFERALCTIAWIWGQAWRKNVLERANLEQFLRPLLDFFDQNDVERMDWDFAMEIKYGRSQFNSWLIGAFAAHGQAAIDLLCDMVAADWADRRKRRYWHAHYQRDFATEIFEAGASKAWAEHWLAVIESEIPKGESSSSRVSEYAAQAQAWLITGNVERADEMRKCYMRSSFGVGYRKDHQLETWLRLVRFFLRSQPQKALDTLHWIAKCVIGLDAAVEPNLARDAARELIVVCTHFHPAQAVAYFQWFLAQRVLWPEDALSGFLIAALETDSAPVDDIFNGVRRLLIPTAESGNWYLMERLVVRLCATRGRDEAVGMLKAIVIAIQRANEEAAERWRSGLARGALACGISLEDIGLSRDVLRGDTSPNNGDNLKQETGVRTMDELEFADLSLADVKALYSQAPVGAYFNWHRLIARIAGRYKRDDLLAIADLFREHPKFPLVVEAIADRLLELGALGECQSLAREALAKSRADGWRRFMDGGTRLAAFTVLLKADSAAALPFYEACADEDPLEPENLETILPLIADDNQRGLVWAEVEEHLRHLLQGCDENIEEPPLVSQSSRPYSEQLETAVANFLPTR